MLLSWLFAFGWFPETWSVFVCLIFVFLTICPFLCMSVGERTCWCFPSATAILQHFSKSKLSYHCQEELSGYLHRWGSLCAVFFELRSFIKKIKPVPIALLLLYCIWTHKGEFPYVYTAFFLCNSFFLGETFFQAKLIFHFFSFFSLIPPHPL